MQGIQGSAVNAAFPREASTTYLTRVTGTQHGLLLKGFLPQRFGDSGLLASRWLVCQCPPPILGVPCRNCAESYKAWLACWLTGSSSHGLYCLPWSSEAGRLAQQRTRGALPRQPTLSNPWLGSLMEAAGRLWTVGFPKSLPHQNPSYLDALQSSHWKPLLFRANSRCSACTSTVRSSTDRQPASEQRWES